MPENDNDDESNNNNTAQVREGVLLTFRADDEAIKRVKALLRSLLSDPEAVLVVVVALDGDQFTARRESVSSALKPLLRAPHQLRVVANEQWPPAASAQAASADDEEEEEDAGGEQQQQGNIFPICKFWDSMARVAWEEGASWVMLLGDDIEIDSASAGHHFQTIRDTFRSLADRVGLRDPDSTFCGCPWWSDRSFPGFPTFPVVGREHATIFEGEVGLIPHHRKDTFVNQDLDPYLQQLYQRYGLAPRMENLFLKNCVGGNAVGNVQSDPRYTRVGACGWRDHVLDDHRVLGDWLRSHSASGDVERLYMVDVIVPSYRVDVAILKRICTMQVPSNWRTRFIFVVDNPDRLQDLGYASDIELEAYLRHHAGGADVMVRANDCNLGASATRNAGLQLTAAEWVLFLDDDVHVEQNLLLRYAQRLDDVMADEAQAQRLCGLIGLVRFPRKGASWRQQGILASHLAFAFEVAVFEGYSNPAWGVTANILIRRLPKVLFDLMYAKTGGGEDIDFCLRLTKAAGPGSTFLTAPGAEARHEFWENPWAHFKGWGRGDGALFDRFPSLSYRAFFNFVECMAFALPVAVVAFLLSASVVFAAATATFFLAPVAEWIRRLLALDSLAYRCQVSGVPFQIASLGRIVVVAALSVFYESAVESGRLIGHIRRGQWHNIGRRFDWHVGRLPDFYVQTLQQEATTLTILVALVAVAMYLVT